MDKWNFVQTESRGTLIEYINPDVPVVTVPAYPGEFREMLVPATLDLEARARLAVNALTAPLDPDYDDELYWIVDLLAPTPAMYHTVDDHVQDKFFQALPLVRSICGSKQNIDVEARLMRTYLRKQGADGLIYIPIRGRPWALPQQPNPWAGLDDLPKGDHWCSVIMLGRVLGAFAIYAAKDKDGPWEKAGRRLVEGIDRILEVRGDIAYPAMRYIDPAVPLPANPEPPRGWCAAVGGWLAQGLAQWCRFQHDERAGELARAIMLYIFRDAGYFGDAGEFLREFPDASDDCIHFHAHTTQIVAALEVVQATGDAEILRYAAKAYNYAVSQGERNLGFFPEWLTYKGRESGACTSELCQVADMIASAVKLSLLGSDHWDDVDRWVRNQFAEGQLTSLSWLRDGHLQVRELEQSPWSGDGDGGARWGTTDRVPERALGSFAGWPSANDFVAGNSWAIMQCCTGNATRALYYVWESVLQVHDDAITINLLLNRRSEAVDIASHIPYDGLVEIWPKQVAKLRVRIPGWVPVASLTCAVNGEDRQIEAAAPWADLGRVEPGDHVVLKMPISEKTEDLVVEKQRYRVVLRGHDIVAIDPPGKKLPLYQRGHYRLGETLWRKTMSFVSGAQLPWA